MTGYGTASALVVVDMQNDFVDPSGGLAVRGGEGVVDAVNRQVEDAAAAGSLVVFTQDWHPESTPHFEKDGGTWPVHCVAGTWGAELHPRLTVPPGAARVRKGTGGEDGYSGFTVRDPRTGAESPTPLADLLRDREITDVTVVGIATDYCVLETALDAARLGWTTRVLWDAVRAVEREPGDAQRARETLQAAGVEVA